MYENVYKRWISRTFCGCRCCFCGGALGGGGLGGCGLVVVVLMVWGLVGDSLGGGDLVGGDLVGGGLAGGDLVGGGLGGGGLVGGGLGGGGLVGRKNLKEEKRKRFCSMSAQMAHLMNSMKKSFQCGANSQPRQYFTLQATAPFAPLFCCSPI